MHIIRTYAYALLIFLLHIYIFYIHMYAQVNICITLFSKFYVSNFAQNIRMHIVLFYLFIEFQAFLYLYIVTTYINGI